MSGRVDPAKSLAAAQKHGRTEEGAPRIVVRWGQHYVSTSHSKPEAQGILEKIVRFFAALLQDIQKTALRLPTPADQALLEAYAGYDPTDPESCIEHHGYYGRDPSSVAKFVQDPKSMRNNKPLLEQFVRTPDGHLYFIEPRSVRPGISSMIFVPNEDFDQAYSVVLYNPETGESILNDKNLRFTAKKYSRLYTLANESKTQEAKNILLRLIKRNGEVKGLNPSDQELANCLDNPQVRAIILEAYEHEYIGDDGHRAFNIAAGETWTDEQIVEDVLQTHNISDLESLKDLSQLNRDQHNRINEALNQELTKYCAPGNQRKINPATNAPWTDAEILADLPASAIEATKKRMGTLVIDTNRKGEFEARVFSANAKAKQLKRSSAGTLLTIPKDVWKNVSDIDLSKPDEYYVPPPPKDDETRSEVSEESFATAPGSLGAHSVTSVSTSTDSGDLTRQPPADRGLTELRSDAERRGSELGVADRRVALGEDALAQTRTRIATLETRVAALEAELARGGEMTTDDRDTEVARLTDDLTAARELLAEQATEHTTLRQQLGEAQDRVSVLQAALEEARRREAADREAMKSELASAQAHATELQSRLRTRVDAERELQGEITRMSTALEVVQRELRQLQEVQAGDREAQVATRQALTQAYQTSLATLRQREAQQNAHLDSLREDLASKEAEFNELKEQLEIRERELALARTPQPPLISPLQLATLREEVETTRRAAETAQAEQEALQEANQRLREELEALQSSTRTAAEEQQTALAQRETTIASLTQKKEELEVQTAQLQEKCDEAEEEFLGSQTNFAVMRLAHGTTREIMAIQAEKLKTAQAEAAEAREAYEKQTRAFAAVEAALKRNMTELERLSSEQVTTFAETLASLEREYDEQIAENQTLVAAQTSKLADQERLITTLREELEEQTRIATLPPPSSQLDELRAQLEASQRALEAAHTRIDSTIEMHAAAMDVAQQVQREQRDHIAALMRRTRDIADLINREQRAQHTRLTRELTDHFARKRIGTEEAEHP